MMGRDSRQAQSDPANQVSSDFKEVLLSQHLQTVSISLSPSLQVFLGSILPFFFLQQILNIMPCI